MHISKESKLVTAKYGESRYFDPCSQLPLGSAWQMDTRLRKFLRHFALWSTCRSIRPAIRFPTSWPDSPIDRHMIHVGRLYRSTRHHSCLYRGDVTNTKLPRDWLPCQPARTCCQLPSQKYWMHVHGGYCLRTYTLLYTIMAREPEYMESTRQWSYLPAVHFRERSRRPPQTFVSLHDPAKCLRENRRKQAEMAKIGHFSRNPHLCPQNTSGFRRFASKSFGNFARTASVISSKSHLFHFLQEPKEDTTPATRFTYMTKSAGICRCHASSTASCAYSA
jgi:hypothetical protein